jgi:hypothetical protein
VHQYSRKAPPPTTISEQPILHQSQPMIICAQLRWNNYLRQAPSVIFLPPAPKKQDHPCMHKFIQSSSFGALIGSLLKLQRQEQALTTATSI